MIQISITPKTLTINVSKIKTQKYIFGPYILDKFPLFWSSYFGPLIFEIACNVVPTIILLMENTYMV